MFHKKDAAEGAVTPFQAVCTALAATVGTGNIAGVAGAIAIGGPGAWLPPTMAKSAARAAAAPGSALPKRSEGRAGGSEGLVC